MKKIGSRLLGMTSHLPSFFGESIWTYALVFKASSSELCDMGLILAS